MNKKNKQKSKETHKRNGEKNDFGVEKYIILERDKYRCRSCGEKNIKLEIHHIDGNGKSKKKSDKNNNLDNLITLCRKCHRKADCARIMKERKLKGFWSISYDKCVKCGKRDSRHTARGVCNRCYNLKRRKYKRNYYREHYGVLTKK